jgi:hypothetical protein
MRTACLIFAAFLQVGCVWPERIVVRPSAFGRIIDAQSGRAIVGADVRMDSSDNQPETCVTDSAGNFSFAQRRKLVLVWIIPRGDPSALSSKLTIDDPDYISRTIPFVGDTYDAGSIVFQRRQPPTAHPTTHQ